jgi:inner membrane protein
MLVGWVALERVAAARRDKALIMLASVAPDLDGIGIVVDFATRMLGLPPTDYYQTARAGKRRPRWRSRAA